MRALSQPTATQPPRASPLPRRGRFLAATFFWMLVVEVLFRAHGGLPSFWEPVAGGSAPTDIIFIGTSRVAAAVDASAFRSEFPSAPQFPRIVNAGAGYSVAAEYYLALRNTLDAQPALLKGATIFIEAPGGMGFTERWSDPWPHADAPHMLTPFLHAEDLAHYWRGPHPLEDKVSVAFDWLFKPSLTYTDRHFFGAMLLNKARSGVDRALSVLRAAVPVTAATAVDLASMGGIRTDDAGIVLARRLGVEVVAQAKLNQQPIDWDQTILADYVRLAQAHGIRVVFFAPPLPPPFQTIYATPTRLRDQASFQAQARRWHAPVLRPDFPVTDEDFPDGWHLRQSRAAAYTQALYAAWKNDSPLQPEPRTP